MDYNLLTDHEKKIIYQCVNALLDGPFIPKSLFHTLLGINRSDFKKFANEWTGDSIKNITEAEYIHRALLQLIEYPHGQDDEVWIEYVSVPKHNVAEILYKLTGIDKPPPKTWNGIIQGYFTPKAQKKWEKFNNHQQNHILTNVWCPHCQKRTTITNYEGGINTSDNISIYGKCVNCFKNINLTIDEEVK